MTPDKAPPNLETYQWDKSTWVKLSAYDRVVSERDALRAELDKSDLAAGVEFERYRKLEFVHELNVAESEKLRTELAELAFINATGEQRGYLTGKAERDQLREENERLVEVCKSLNREKNDTFSQSCKNYEALKLAKAALEDIDYFSTCSRCLANTEIVGQALAEIAKVEAGT